MPHKHRHKYSHFATSQPIWQPCLLLILPLQLFTHTHTHTYDMTRSSPLPSLCAAAHDKTPPTPPPPPSPSPSAPVRACCAGGGGGGRCLKGRKSSEQEMEGRRIVGRSELPNGSVSIGMGTGRDRARFARTCRVGMRRGPASREEDHEQNTGVFILNRERDSSRNRLT